MVKKKLFSSLKVRLYLLLFLAVIFPIVLIASFTVTKIYDLYKYNTNLIINNELNHLKGNIETAYQGMLYISQQLMLDENIKYDLPHSLDDSDINAKIDLLEYFTTQLTIYELSSPGVANITFFYKNNSTNAIKKINTSSLVKEMFPDEKYIISNLNDITYYGPHRTLSKPSSYEVLSILRKVMPYKDGEIYLYIEAINKDNLFFKSTAIDLLKGEYILLSEDNQIIFSSNPDSNRGNNRGNNPYENIDFDDLFENTKNAEKLNDVVASVYENFHWYSIEGSQGFKLITFIDADNYYRYINELSAGYIFVFIIAIIFGVFVCVLIWKSVYTPVKQFERNLKQILKNEKSKDLEFIKVTEMEENFALFTKMQKDIQDLIYEVKKEEEENAKLQIKQLIAKINPHFLHNTLDTLKWYAHKKNYADIESFVSSLNNLLLYNMEKDKNTNLETELKYLDNYIKLQSYKYDFKFKSTINIPVQILKSEIPRFILQPLVENALFYGENKNIEIYLDLNLLENGKIAIQLKNNGNPISDIAIDKIMTSESNISKSGIGVQYVIEILKSNFKDYTSFKISRNSNNETQIDITIPFSIGGKYAKYIDR